MRALRPDHLDVPIPRRYSSKHRGYADGMERHRAAVAAGRATYADPITGYTVFTAAFLAERDYCCESGCRHCPYQP